MYGRKGEKFFKSQVEVATGSLCVLAFGLLVVYDKGNEFHHLRQLLTHPSLNSFFFFMLLYYIFQESRECRQVSNFFSSLIRASIVSTEKH